ncbi:MAG: NUDIX hydrolase [Candidatus Aenigmarchaeota archaeon]|nr:NUDIX hydrolase [Candidatus Aenigmarchaeota archaeon]
MNEETGLQLKVPQILYFEKVFVKYPSYDFIYHMFHANLENRSEIHLNPAEHKSFIWVTPSGAIKLKLIPDLDTCIKLFYKL